MTTPQESLSRISTYMAYAFVLAIGLLLVIQIWAPAQFYPAYLVAYCYWFGLSMGCLALTMIHGMTGGSWGLVIRRIVESGYSTIPFMAILFLPISLNVRSIYPWTDSEFVERHEALLRKAAYLNTTGFEWRAIGYFIVWIVMTWQLDRLSPGLGRSVDSERRRRLQTVSGAGFVIFGFTVTLAMVDWAMSLEPLWYSTMYGLIHIAGMGVTSLSFSVVVAVMMRNCKPWRFNINAQRLNDLGNLMLAAVMFWAYCSFFQFLVIWSGNLPEENEWYVKRSMGGWQSMAVILMTLHFAVPFLLLLSRHLKRQPIHLAGIALLLLAMHYLDLYWTVVPGLPDAMRDNRIWSFGVDAFAALAIGFGWMALFLRTLSRRAGMPFNEPSATEEIHEHSRHASFA